MMFITARESKQVQICMTQNFNLGAGDLNSSPHICSANVLLTEPSLQALPPVYR